MVSEKKWHDETFEQLIQMHDIEWIRIDRKGQFESDLLNEYDPDFIFFLHWSYIIPASIHQRFNCIVFHMTDLPYGRGGSPLQNLIVRGINVTKLSAIKVAEGIDTGDIYLKEDLPLYGTAEEIFIRAGRLIVEMIKKILDQRIIPYPQKGDVTVFNRRKPQDSNIAELKTLEEIYDYIRMLDCEGYPPAFIETNSFMLEFSRAALKSDSVIADVRIIKK